MRKLRLLHFEVFLIWILFFSTLLNAEETPIVHDKKILILHSYHQGLTWTDGQDHGIRDILGPRQDIDVSTEYLDSKRTSLEDISEPFFDFLARKYAATTFDAIIVSDNNALTFLSIYHKTLFPGIPVVFCGINNYQPEMLKGFDGLVTGVIQTLDPKGTVDLIQKLQPSVQTIVIVSGTTATGWAIRQKVYSEFTELKESLDTVWLDGLETSDLINRLSGLSRNHAVLLCNFNRDAKGNYYSHEQSARMISKASNAPVYAMEDHYLGTGVTGGYMNSSKDQGIVAGRICLEILKTGKIPEVVMVSPNAIMFDYKAMSRFGLDASILPHSAIIINRPVSFYEQYKTLIWNTVVVFCLLLLALLGVSLGLMRARMAEKDLRDSEEKFRALIESSSDWIWEVDAQGVYTYASPQVEEILGYKPEEVVGKSPFDLMPPEEEKRIIRVFEDLVAAGKPIITLENVNRHKDGRRIILETSGVPIFDETGKVIGYRGMDRDITERKRVEEELQASHQQLLGIIEFLPDATYVIDSEKKVIAWNLALEEMTGVSKEEVLGKGDYAYAVPFWGRREPILIDLLAMRDEQAEYKYKKLIKKGNTICAEAFVPLLYGGKGAYISALASPLIDENGHVVGAIESVRDITERRQAEEELRQSQRRLSTLMGNLPGMAYRCFNDRDWTMEFVSEGCQDLTGYPPHDLIGNKRISYNDLIHPDDQRHTSEQVEEAVSQGKSFQLLYRIRTESGQEKWIWEHGVGVFSDEGELLTLEGFMTDITDRKRTEEMAFDLARILEESLNEIYIFDAKTLRFLQVNKGARDNLGYSVEQFQELTPLDLKTEFSVEYFDDLLRPLRTKEKERIEFVTTHQRKDGSFYDVEVHLEMTTFRSLPVFVAIALDITERRQAEEALRESENRFRDFFANAPIGFHIFGPNLTIIDINDAELDMIGYTRDEIVSKKTWSDLVIPAQAEQLKKHWNDIITRGSVRNLEYTLVHKQGHHVNVLLNASSRFDEVGQFINSRGSILNITDRKQAEDALLESEKKYRMLFEQSADATLIIEEEKFIDCNQATVDMLGYANKEELLQTHPSELSPEYQPDGRGSFEKANEIMSIAFERGSHRFEWAHKRRNGEVFPVEVLLTPVALADRKFFHVVWRDITDRKRAEERLRAEQVFSDTIVQGIPGLFYIFEKSSARFVRRNDNWPKITGYSEEELDAMTAFDLFEEGADRDLCKRRMQEVYDSGLSSMENLLLTKSGKKIPFYFTGDRLVIDSNTYLVGLGLDITDRKRAEEQREELLRTLTAKNKELQSVVYIASHDLKSPLVNISGFSAELDQSCKDITKIFKELDVSDEVKQRILPIIYEDLPESIKFISAGIHKMKMLLDGLLQVSRVGTMDIDIEPLNVNGIVKNVCKSMEFQFKEKDVDVNFDDLPGCLGDEKMIDQLFSNLIGNALKYLYPGRKGKIDITGTVDGSQSVYCVQDNGVGIHPDHQSKVFEIFHRLNPDDSVGGEGLGLTIITRILDRNNGTIRVESEEGKGSKFYVSLPTA